MLLRGIAPQKLTLIKSSILDTTVFFDSETPNTVCVVFGPLRGTLLVAIDHWHLFAKSHQEILLTIPGIKLASRDKLHLARPSVKHWTLAFSQVACGVLNRPGVSSTPVVFRFANFVRDKPCNHVRRGH